MRTVGGFVDRLAAGGHEAVLRRAIETAAGLAVTGAVAHALTNLDDADQPEVRIPFYAGGVDPRRHRGHVAVFLDTPPAYLDIRLRRRSAERGRYEEAIRTPMQPLLYMEVTPGEQQ